MFIDGALVSSATAINTITDPERVEILKGPQAAYFGRQTFARAVNVVIKRPSDHWTGTFDGTVGTHANHACPNIQDASVLNSMFSYSAVYSALYVGLRDLRTVGVRVHLGF